MRRSMAHGRRPIRRVQVFEPVRAHHEAGRRKVGMTDHEQHLLRIGAEARNLCVKPAAQRHRLVEHALRWCTPFVDRALRALVVPYASLAQCGHVGVGQLLPGARVVKAERGVQQRRL